MIDLDAAIKSDIMMPTGLQALSASPKVVMRHVINTHAKRGPSTLNKDSFAINATEQVGEITSHLVVKPTLSKSPNSPPSSHYLRVVSEESTASINGAALLVQTTNSYPTTAVPMTVVIIRSGPTAPTSSSGYVGQSGGAGLPTQPVSVVEMLTMKPVGGQVLPTKPFAPSMKPSSPA